MKLWILSNYGEVEKTISNEATEKIIKETMDSLDWNNFHQVILEKENGDLAEVGGSLTNDGLAIMYQEDGKEHVIIKVPKTIIELTDFLILYLKGNDEFKKKHNFD